MWTFFKCTEFPLNDDGLSSGSSDERTNFKRSKRLFKVCILHSSGVFFLSSLPALAVRLFKIFFVRILITRSPTADPHSNGALFQSFQQHGGRKDTLGLEHRNACLRLLSLAVPCAFRLFCFRGAPYELCKHSDRSPYLVEFYLCLRNVLLLNFCFKYS